MVNDGKKQIDELKLKINLLEEERKVLSNDVEAYRSELNRLNEYLLANPEQTSKYEDYKNKVTARLNSSVDRIIEIRNEIIEYNKSITKSLQYPERFSTILADEYDKKIKELERGLSNQEKEIDLRWRITFFNDKKINKLNKQIKFYQNEKLMAIKSGITNGDDYIREKLNKKQEFEAQKKGFDSLVKTSGSIDKIRYQHFSNVNLRKMNRIDIAIDMARKFRNIAKLTKVKLAGFKGIITGYQVDEERVNQK